MAKMIFFEKKKKKKKKKKTNFKCLYLQNVNDLDWF